MNFCKFADCRRSCHDLGWCAAHYRQIEVEHKFPTSIRACAIQNHMCAFAECNRPTLAKGWCSSHYQQVVVKGKEPSQIKTYLRDSVDKRFWRRVEKGIDHWIWVGGVNDKGYGLLSVGKNKLKYAHRFSWELANEPIPEGKSVCHTCDIPRCVNPDHLFLGSHQENMKDMAVKGRVGTRKLSVDLVKKIAELRKSGVTRKDIQKITGVKLSTLKDILSGKNWSHVTGFLRKNSEIRINQQWWIYTLESISNKGKLYVGVCVNVSRRLKQHNGEKHGGAVYTKNYYRPWKITEIFGPFSKGEAFSIETKTKKKHKLIR